MADESVRTESAPSFLLQPIAQELIDYTRAAAKHLKLVENDSLIDHLSLAGYDAADAKTREEEVEKRAAELAPFSEKDKFQLAQMMAVERITQNAIGHMYRKLQFANPRERFAAYFREGLSEAKTREEKSEFVHALMDAKEKMVISVVQTMHPTIFHSEFARSYEHRLTLELEHIANEYRRAERNGGRLDEAMVQTYFRQAQDVVEECIAELASGREKLTPDTAVGVSAENELDRENHVEMKKAFRYVVDDYNAALDEVTGGRDLNLYVDPILALALRDCKIDSANAVWRTWAYSADADGRRSTSLMLSEGIYHQIDIDDLRPEFPSRKRDLRENAHDQMDTVSGLLQRYFNENRSWFEPYCEAFVAEQDACGLAGERISWEDPAHSTILQLGEDERAEFLKQLVRGDHLTDGKGAPRKWVDDSLRFVPESLKEETIAFTERFRREYPGFLLRKGHIDELKAMKRKLDDLQTLKDSDPIKGPALIKDLADEIRGWEIEAHGQKMHFELDPEGLFYYPQETEENRNSGFLKDIYKTRFMTVVHEDGRKEAVLDEKASGVMEPDERRKVLDVVKRLQVLDYAIGRYGDKVADRYQIANFSHASDFYAALLLFKGTGIITIDANGEVERIVQQGFSKDMEGTDGRTIVVSPKLSLQPLLETEQDQKNAIGLFRELLKDPLVVSYYRALGNKADIMLGYSDGAKSAGNFASEWSIRQCGRELTEVFAEHGIEVNFFHGRGRGDSRGGQFDEGQNARMADPALLKSLRYDETIQSDGPMNGAISPARGQDMMASVIMGTLTGKREADTLFATQLEWARSQPLLAQAVALFPDRTISEYPLTVRMPETPEQRNAQREIEKAWIESKEAIPFKSQEAAINFIAGISSKTYLKHIAEDPPATMKLIEAVPDNSFKASRPSARRNDFEGLRAITVEYAFNMADAPLHYIGTKTALEKFIKDKQSVISSDGRRLTGMAALRELYANNPFFHDELNKTLHGLSDYDPAILRSYAKVGGVEDWAKKCLDELSGTRELVAQITQSRQAKEVESSDLEDLRKRTQELEKASHALILSYAVKDGAIKPMSELGRGYNIFRPGTAEERARSSASIEGRTLRNALFVPSEVHRGRGEFPPQTIRDAVAAKHLTRQAPVCGMSR